MKQFALIGMDNFGRRVLEELILLDCEILLIDRDREVIEFYKDQVTEAYIADVINQETMERLLPDDVDVVILDLGNNIEASILAVNYIKKKGNSKIFVKAETEQHGEILKIVGADHVVYPNREAAKKLTPLLMSDSLFNYLPISNGLVMAEVKPQEKYFLKTLEELDLRKELGLNVVAFRHSSGGEFSFFVPGMTIKEDHVLLVVGSDESVVQFTGNPLPARKKGISDLFRSLFIQR
ncbi:MAG: TrkA family potassium uptake protein [Spirochaetaceae bacterium]|jgi:trk system potassium uptake protein TrkA|nr:TrkA family potassium uptake protein [Spirochaetaceae bacterium]